MNSTLILDNSINTVPKPINSIIRKTAAFGVLMALFLLPIFNSFPYSLSHFMRSPSYYGVIMFLPLSIVYGLRQFFFFRIPRVLLPALFFVFWACISLSANLLILTPTNQNGTSLLMDMFRQMGVYLLLIMTAWGVRSILVSGIVNLYQVITIIRWSAIYTLIFCFIEALAYFSELSLIREFYASIEPHFHDIYVVNPGPITQPERIRGLAQEPSYFGGVMAFLFPWLLYNALVFRKFLDKLLILTALIIVFLTYSRTVYIIIAVEILAFLSIVLVNARLFRRITPVFLGIIFILSIGSFYANVDKVITSLFKLEKTSYSNAMRYGTAYAQFEVGKDNFLFGVGPGMVDLYMIDNIPSFMERTQVWKNKWSEVEGGVPMLNVPLRLFGELGFPGFVAFIGMFLYPAFKLAQLFFKSTPNMGHLNYLYMIMVPLLIGLLAASFAIGPPTFIGYWCSLGIAWFIIEKKEKSQYIRNYKKINF